MTLTVGDLKKALERLNDDMRVVIDTEARTFNVHLASIDHVSSENVIEENIFILFPNYNGTTFCKGECK